MTRSPGIATSRAGSPRSQATAIEEIARKLRQREDMQRSTLRRVVREVLHRDGEAKRDAGVFLGHDAERGCACPSADSGQNRNVLFAIRAEICNRLADYSRAELLLPEN